MRYTLSTEMTGPELWMAIVCEVMADSLQRVDDLRKEFEDLTLAKFKGKNIVEYCDKVAPILLQLEKDDALPAMHLITILNVFCDCSVMDFKVTFMGWRAPIEQFLKESNGKDKQAIRSMSNRVTYEQLLNEGKNAYNNLKSRWGPAKAVKDSPEKAMLAQFKALEAKVSQALEIKPNLGSGGKGGGGQKKNPGGKTCHDCGSEYHFCGHSECPKAKKDDNKPAPDDANDWRKLPAPKEGEPVKKTMKGGKIIHWCPKCNRGKGRWTDTHDAAGHVDGWLKQKKAQDLLAKLTAMDQALIPSIAGWI